MAFWASFVHFWQLVDYGVEASVPVLKTCVDCFTVRRSHANTLQLEKLLALVFKRVLKLPNLGTLLSHALQDADVTPEFVRDLATALGFSVSDKITFALALVDFETSHAKTCGKIKIWFWQLLLWAFVLPILLNDRFFVLQDETYYWRRLSNSVLTMARLSQLSKFRMLFCFSRRPRTSPGIWSPSYSFCLPLNLEMTCLLLLRLSFLHSGELIFSLIPFPVHLFRFCKTLKAFLLWCRCIDSAEDDFDAVLAEIDKEIGVGDLIGELGCGFTADAQQCKHFLSSFAPLREATISRILGHVARTSADLEDNHTTFSTFSLAVGCSIPTDLPTPTPTSWNVDILIETIKQLVSHLKP